jgi:hypothetical protein
LAAFLFGENMPTPISDTYLNVQEARASAVLPAAGAFDANPTELTCPLFGFVTLHFTYTRGAAGGAFTWQMETSPYSPNTTPPAGAGEWTAESIHSAGAVALGADTTSDVQRELQKYGSTAAGAESFVFGPIELRGTVERIRIPAAESGIVGSPGTLQMQAVFSE